MFQNCHHGLAGLRPNLPNTVQTLLQSHNYRNAPAALSRGSASASLAVQQRWGRHLTVNVFRNRESVKLPNRTGSPALGDVTSEGYGKVPDNRGPVRIFSLAMTLGGHSLYRSVRIHSKFHVPGCRARRGRVGAEGDRQGVVEAASSLSLYR